MDAKKLVEELREWQADIHIKYGKNSDYKRIDGILSRYENDKAGEVETLRKRLEFCQKRYKAVVKELANSTPAPVDGLREELADLEHKRWSSWQTWCHKVLRENCPSPELEKVLARWDKQIATEYKDLTEREKDMDRKEADKTLDVLSRHPATESIAELADRDGLRERINMLEQQLDFYMRGHCQNVKEIIRSGKVIFKLQCGDRFVFDEFLSKHKESEQLSRYPVSSESLAELADRKGLSIGHIGSHRSGKWGIMFLATSLWSKGKGKTIMADTYPEAESKARAYLSTLPDREDK